MVHQKRYNYVFSPTFSSWQSPKGEPVVVPGTQRAFCKGRGQEEPWNHGTLLFQPRNGWYPLFIIMAQQQYPGLRMSQAWVIFDLPEMSNTPSTIHYSRGNRPFWFILFLGGLWGYIATFFGTTWAFCTLCGVFRKSNRKSCSQLELWQSEPKRWTGHWPSCKLGPLFRMNHNLLVISV